MKLSLGVKTDPIEYRYTYEWLFDLMAESGVRYAQLGSFFEMYSLDDDWFHALREKAEARGIRIKSVFTSHREMGGFLSGDPAFEKITGASYRKLIRVAAALGADFAGSNMGCVYNDRMELKEAGVARYVRAMQELSHYAKEQGLRALTVEPMSCLAEPPTLPEECADLMRGLAEYHAAHADTVPVYFCGDISHGYADGERRVVHDNWSLFEAQIPRMCEFHFKNTDAVFNSTFGFGEEERKRGIVDLGRLRSLVEAGADAFPVEDVTGYLELNNIKMGRDYTDCVLGPYLKESLAALKQAFAFSP